MNTNVEKGYRYGGCLVAGVIIGLFIGFADNICWNLEISLFSVISLVSTVFVTIYVAKVIQKALQQRSNKDNLIIKRIDVIDDKLERIGDYIQLDGFSYKVLTSNFTTLYVSLKRVLEEVKRFYPDVDNTGYMINNMTLELRKLQNLCTYTQPRREGNPIARDITIDQDKVNYSRKKRLDVVNGISSFRDKIMDLQMKIYSN